MQGLLQALLVRLYAKITEELGLAPGGEFRAAYNEVYTFTRKNFLTYIQL